MPLACGLCTSGEKAVNGFSQDHASSAYVEASDAPGFEQVIETATTEARIGGGPKNRKGDRLQRSDLGGLIYLHALCSVCC